MIASVAPSQSQELPTAADKAALIAIVELQIDTF
jgi:hypothetical protein